MSAKRMTERFEMRLAASLLKQVDEWRGRQGDVPSRAEAIRRLIEVGLAATRGEKPVRLSDGGKLIVVMLSDLFKQLKLNDGVIDPDFALEAIVGGHTWGLEWQYPGIFRRHEDTRAVVLEVFNIVQMWSFLESGYDMLAHKDKARVAARAGLAGKQVRFDGFDAKNENEHLGVARFLIEQIGRFPEFKGRDLDAHGPTLNTHRRMLAMFEPMRRNLMGRHLTADDIMNILQAGLHPSGRNENSPKQATSRAGDTGDSGDRRPGPS